MKFNFSRKNIIIIIIVIIIIALAITLPLVLVKSSSNSTQIIVGQTPTSASKPTLGPKISNIKYRFIPIQNSNWRSLYLSWSPPSSDLTDLYPIFSYSIKSSGTTDWRGTNGNETSIELDGSYAKGVTYDIYIKGNNSYNVDYSASIQATCDI